jgi:hypothetical protein
VSHERRLTTGAIAKDTVDRATVQRVERGWILANLGKVEKDGPLYNVRSSTGRGMYVVDLSRDTCECKDWMRRKDTCKHLVAATLVAARG